MNTTLYVVARSHPGGHAGLQNTGYYDFDLAKRALDRNAEQGDTVIRCTYDPADLIRDPTVMREYRFVAAPDQSWR